MTKSRVSEASLLSILTQVMAAFNFLSESIELISNNIDTTSPLYVRNLPSDDQIQNFVQTIFKDDELFREGVLIAPMVFAKKNAQGIFIGHSVLLRVEGVGSSPEGAVLSSRFLSSDARVVALDDIFQDHFSSELEFMKDENYERVRDRERGIFLKLNAKGTFIGRSDYREIEVEKLRVDADRQAAFLDGLASAEEQEMSADLARRVRYYDEVIKAISDRLVVSGVMEHVARAQRLHEEARQLLVSAQKDLDTAARWGRAVAITQWIGIGLQAASIIRSEFVQAEAKAEMAEAFTRIEGAQDLANQRLDQYNSRLNDLNIQLETYADRVTPLEAFSTAIQHPGVARYYLGYGIEGIGGNGEPFDVRYFGETINK